MLLVTGGRVVTPAGARPGDILVEGERILAVGERLAAPPGARVVEADGCLVLPGVIDCHVHYRLTAGAASTRDDFATASRSGAAGGVTTAIDYAHQRRGQPFPEAIAARQAEAEGRCYIDYAFHLIVTDVTGGQLAELARVVAEGVPSAKIYTTYKAAGFYLDDWSWLALLREARRAGMLVTVHAENDDLLEGLRAAMVREGRTALSFHAESRPALAEVETVRRGLLYAREAGAPIYFVHQTSPAAVEAIWTARAAGQAAIAETCPHYLVLDESVYRGDEPERFIMTPPLRSTEEQRGLWEQLRAGRISTVGSDHCGYTLDQRRGLDFTRAVPGIPGTEMLLPLLYSEGVAKGRITLSQLVRVLCRNPALIFGLFPRKGTLEPGADADLVIFDPRERWICRAEELHSAAGYTPYEGMTLQGRVRTTISRGEIVYDRGAFPARPGRGRFVAGLPFDPAVLPEI